ncbi:MAG: hypothetical protein OHK0039_26710 [Bacteroidia bacterium]
MGRDEGVDEAAVRVLQERTGLAVIYLQQLRLFGGIDRSDPGHVERLVAEAIIPPGAADWFGQRFVTMGYYALVEYSRVEAPRPDATAEDCSWCSLAQLPPLMLDHAQILATAYETLRQHLYYQPIGLNLLPRQFIMPELQSLYETVLDRQLDRRNFQRRMLGYGIVVPTGERRRGGPHKAPLLYTFDEARYRQALREGLNPGW